MERGPRDGGRSRRGRKGEEIRCVVGTYQLSMMDVIIMYCKHMLITMKKPHHVFWVPQPRSSSCVLLVTIVLFAFLRILGKAKSWSVCGVPFGSSTWVIILRFVGSVVCTQLSAAAHCWAGFRGLDGAVFLSSPVGGHLGCFQFGAFTNKVAGRVFVNKGIYGPVIPFLLGK